MTNKKPFDKENTTKIPFGDLIELINQKCDYKFAIIDNEVDEELMTLAKKEGIDLTGYKHVIETSGVSHSESRHGNRSNDRTPLTLEDYLLIPYIIKYRDKGHLFKQENQETQTEDLHLPQDDREPLCIRRGNPHRQK